MTTAQIEKKVKYVCNAEGRNTEVILPYGLFKELLELKSSTEIYEIEFAGDYPSINGGPWIFECQRQPAAPAPR
jgi:hypothetical protein